MSDDRALTDLLAEEGEREDLEKGVGETWVRLGEIAIEIMVEWISPK